jgi:hypothetical protein
LGGRPTAIIDLGWLKVKVDAEYQKRTATTQTNEPGDPPRAKDPVEKRINKGVGASVQLVLAPIVDSD